MKPRILILFISMALMAHAVEIPARQGAGVPNKPLEARALPKDTDKAPNGLTYGENRIAAKILQETASSEAIDQFVVDVQAANKKLNDKIRDLAIAANPDKRELILRAIRDRPLPDPLVMRKKLRESAFKPIAPPPDSSRNK